MLILDVDASRPALPGNYLEAAHRMISPEHEMMDEVDQMRGLDLAAYLLLGQIASDTSDATVGTLEAINKVALAAAKLAARKPTLISDGMAALVRDLEHIDEGIDYEQFHKDVVLGRYLPLGPIVDELE